MVDIESLIPHREPIKIITEMLEIRDDSGLAAAVVGENWPTCDGRTVCTLVFIEAIAQTAAVVGGYKLKKEGKDIQKGWLVGIKSAEFKRDRIPLGTRISVFVRSEYALEQYAIIEGIVKSDDEVLLTAVLQAVRLDPNAS